MVEAVHADGADFKATHRIVRGAQVRGPDRRGQAIDSVVGNAHGVVEAVHFNERSHGPEDFFAGDSHLVVHAAEEGGADIAARAFRCVAAHFYLGAFGLALGNVVQHACLLADVDHRA